MTHRAGTYPPPLSAPSFTVAVCENNQPIQHYNSQLTACSYGSKLTATAKLPPYLVLLRVGFALPVALLRRRCALTAPFHPYPAGSAGTEHFVGTYRTSGAVYFLWHFPSSHLRVPTRVPSRTLSGTLPCGVRTFLPALSPPPVHASTSMLPEIRTAGTEGTGRPSDPAANLFIIFAISMT